MPSSTADSPVADDDWERSPRSALLLPIVVTPIVLFPLRSHPLESIPVILTAFSGFGLGLGIGIFLDRYRTRLQRWNDGVVIAVFVVPTFLVLVGSSRLSSGDIAGYQGLGLAALLWGTTLQSLLME